MFISSNEQTTLLPIDSLGKVEEKLKESLNTEIIRMTIAESNLLGLYVAMNSNGMILPNVTTENEIAQLKKTGLNVYKSNEKHNAHGNNISVNDKGGIINTNISSDERKKIEDVLGVELIPMRIADYATVGSCIYSGNKGFLAHFRTNEQELKEIEDVLKVKGNVGTVNTGTGFVSYGVIANAKGYVVGEATTAYEMGRIEESLGYL